MSEDKDKIQAILDRNKEKEFVRRIEALKDAETDDSNSLDMGGGYRGTHMMAAEVDEEGNWYVFPTIVNMDGRYFVKDRGRQYDIIQIAGADTDTSNLTSGALSVSGQAIFKQDFCQQATTQDNGQEKTGVHIDPQNHERQQP